MQGSRYVMTLHPVSVLMPVLMSVLLSFFVLLGPTPVAFAGPDDTSGPSRRQELSLMPKFDLDLALYYSDHLGVPGGGKMLSAANSPVAAVKPGSRDLGVERARIGIAWNNAGKSGVSLVLRPEYASLPGSGAGSLSQSYREIDHRAGDVYSPAPSVKLLDAYAVSMNASEAFDVEVGVFETLLPRRVAYQEVLEFGLNVALPRKFSGAKLNWHWNSAKPVPGVETTGAGFQLLFVGIHGNDDRGDAYKVGEKTFDEAPATSDPYSGGATYIGWTVSPRFNTGILMGVGDHGFEQSTAGGVASTTGKRSETFGSLGASLKVGPDQKAQIGLDVRMARDSFALNAGKAAPLNQRSISLTYAAPVTATILGLAGLHGGTSQRHDAADSSQILEVEGYQTDLGMLYALDRDLDITVMGAWERRSIKSPGQNRTGGFGTVEPKNTIQRLGVRLNYLISGS